MAFAGHSKVSNLGIKLAVDIFMNLKQQAIRYLADRSLCSMREIFIRQGAGAYQDVAGRKVSVEDIVCVEVGHSLCERIGL